MAQSLQDKLAYLREKFKHERWFKGVTTIRDAPAMYVTKEFYSLPYAQQSSYSLCGGKRMNLITVPYQK